MMMAVKKMSGDERNGERIETIGIGSDGATTTMTASGGGTRTVDEPRTIITIAIADETSGKNASETTNMTANVGGRSEETAAEAPTIGRRRGEIGTAAGVEVLMIKGNAGGIGNTTILTDKRERSTGTTSIISRLCIITGDVLQKGYLEALGLGVGMEKWILA